jgi:hypothetical protein
MAKSATKKAAPKKTTTKAEPHKVVSSDGDTPETKRSTKDQQDAAEKLFQGADGAVRTEEQHENHVRRQALGF